MPETADFVTHASVSAASIQVAADEGVTGHR